MLPIDEIAGRLGVLPEELEPYGRYKAKLSEEIFSRLKSRKDGKLVLVTAINPTPAGEGKPPLRWAWDKLCTASAKSSHRPAGSPPWARCLASKAVPAGGGYSQVVPMEDINLHFTGDMHAITAANNLLCAMIDNHRSRATPLPSIPGASSLSAAWI